MITGTPATPTLDVVTNTSIGVNWNTNGPTTDNGPITWVIEWADDQGFTTNVGSAGIDADSNGTYNDTPLPPGTTKYYRIVGTDADPSATTSDYVGGVTTDVITFSSASSNGTVITAFFDRNVSDAANVSATINGDAIVLGAPSASSTNIEIPHRPVVQGETMTWSSETVTAVDATTCEVSGASVDTSGAIAGARPSLNSVTVDSSGGTVTFALGSTAVAHAAATLDGVTFSGSITLETGSAYGSSSDISVGVDSQINGRFLSNVGYTVNVNWKSVAPNVAMISNSAGTDVDVAVAFAVTNNSTVIVADSPVVPEAGTTLTFGYANSANRTGSESSAAGDGGFTVSASGGAVTVTEWSIAGSATTLTLSRTVFTGETVTISLPYGGAYAAWTAGIESLNNVAVTNNSTQSPPSAGHRKSAMVFFP